MIKGIIGYKVVSYKDVEPILMKLRSHAMQYPGFVSAENLVSDKDNERFASTSQSSCDGSGQNNSIQDNAHSKVALIRRQSLSITYNSRDTIPIRPTTN
jgi:hypothetical protein